MFVILTTCHLICLCTYLFVHVLMYILSWSESFYNIVIIIQIINDQWPWWWAFLVQYSSHLIHMKESSGWIDYKTLNYYDCNNYEMRYQMYKKIKDIPVYFPHNYCRDMQQSTINMSHDIQTKRTFDSRPCDGGLFFLHILVCVTACTNHVCCWGKNPFLDAQFKVLFAWFCRQSLTQNWKACWVKALERLDDNFSSNGHFIIRFTRNKLCLMHFLANFINMANHKNTNTEPSQVGLLAVR